MNYPSIEEVYAADRFTLCRWHRFLRSPENEAEVEISNLIYARWRAAGGFTPQISKALGWEIKQ